VHRPDNRSPSVKKENRDTIGNLDTDQQSFFLREDGVGNLGFHMIFEDDHRIGMPLHRQVDISFCDAYSLQDLLHSVTRDFGGKKSFHTRILHIRR
jgi:hypothetical protein